jgi:Hypothetical glycosyl hydrolase 6/Beta-galactosidase trimerisation domain
MPTRPPWYPHTYRRAVIDMHIPDWDEGFLAKFDAQRYARALVEAKAQSIVAYAQSHVGLFNYPTKVGKQHAGWKGRDGFGAILAACRDKGIAVVAYTSLIFDRWAADNHPEWRIVAHDGKPMGQGGRHGLVCPNSPYREYVRAFAQEIGTRYDVNGARFDMTFWPGLCFCSHCKQRFANEVGGDLPRTIDWTDARWVAFQHARERWLAEFASIATDAIRQTRPGASVEHQASTFPLNWQFGVSEALVSRNDFLQGDFYGDALQGSFVRKLLESLTPHRPFGYETSVKLELKDHTSLKSEALLEAKASAAIADAAAFVFIDGIDPAGTVDPRPYARMGRVFGRLMKYYNELGGDRVQDVGIYYSTASKFNLSVGPRPVGQPDTSDAHTEAAMQAARRLLGAHVPFGVVTRQGLKKLDGLNVLILPCVNVLSEDEIALIRDYVRRGGAVYASGGTSILDASGTLRGDFGLAEVFGVSLRKADWSPREHYLAPTAAGRAHFGEFDAMYPAFTSGHVHEVVAASGAEVLATTTLPWPAPDGTRFASIHSNPPWVPTDRPEVVFHRFGKGRAVYSASVLETVPALGPAFLSLLRLLSPQYRLEVKAPECVEATLFHQPGRHRYVLGLVSFQATLPNVPIEGIEATVRLGAPIRSLTILPSGEKLPLRRGDGSVSFTVPKLETLGMFAIEMG